MIGQVDAAVVDHRHGKEHLPAARPLLEAKIPLFIDKPFCYRQAEGKRFLARAAELGVPVCSFSTLPKQASYRAFAKKMRQLGSIQAVVSTGSCDIKSKWGGVFFYGIHQVDMVLRLLGTDIRWAEIHRGAGANHTAILTYPRRLRGYPKLGGGGAAPGFHLSAIGEKGRMDEPITFDESSYLSGIRDFCTMFRTGKNRRDRADHAGAGGSVGGAGEVSGEKEPSADTAITEKIIQTIKEEDGSMTIQLKSADQTHYDAIALGEVLMRIDPGQVPTARARTARIWHGGGETNVAEGLSYCFGLRAAVITALVDDGIGRNIENQLREAGLDTGHIIWFNNSGKGQFSTDAKGTLHNGINFTWAGKGLLPSVTEYYRAHAPSERNRAWRCGLGPSLRRVGDAVV